MFVYRDDSYYISYVEVVVKLVTKALNSLENMGLVLFVLGEWKELFNDNIGSKGRW